MRSRIRPVLFAASRKLGVLVVCTSLLLSCHFAHAAESGGLQVGISPATIQLGPGEVGDVILTITNTHSTAVDSIQLQSLSDVGVRVKLEPMKLNSIGAGASVAWPIHLTTSAAGRTVGMLQFVLRYRREVNGVAVPGTAVAALTIQERPPLAIDKLVDVRLEAAIDSLKEKPPTQMYLVVINRASVPVTITGLKAYAPASININPETLKVDPVLLPPQSSHVFPITASVSNQARSTNERIVFQADLAWNDAGRPQKGSVLVAQTVPVSVFGESDILKLLGVPSFFLLPGFLALTTFTLLWTRVVPKKGLTPALTTAEFGLIAVTLSFAALPIFRWGTGRDYLAGYGMRDVMLVWFGSVIAGLAVWIVVAGIIDLVHHYRVHKEDIARRTDAARRQEELARRTPQRDDAPLTILAKLGLNTAKFPLDQVDLQLNQNLIPCFLLLEPQEGIPQAWVAPPVQLRATGHVSRTRDQLIDDLQQPRTRDDRTELMRVLRGAQEAGWDVRWGGALGVLTGPQPVDPNQVQKRQRLAGLEFVGVP